MTQQSPSGSPDDTPPEPWMDMTIPELERWRLMVKARKDNALPLETMLEIAGSFSEETRQLIKEIAADLIEEQN